MTKLNKTETFIICSIAAAIAIALGFSPVGAIIGAYVASKIL